MTAVPRDRPVRAPEAVIDLLDDGRPVRIRPLRPEDRQVIIDRYAGLSEGSRRHRFQTAPLRLPDR